jgi:ribose transport system permease protein
MTDARPTAVQRATRMLIRQPIWGFVVLIFVFFSLVSDHFLSLGNFSNILVQTSTIGLIALGMTLVMINGNIDLSVGATLALAANIAIDMLGWPMFAGLGDWVILPAVVVALATGVLLGALNGVIVWKTGVNAFIVTLGAMLGVRGLVFIYTGEQSFFSMNFTYSDIGSSSILGLPTLAVIFIVFAPPAMFDWRYPRSWIAGQSCASRCS